MKTSRIVKTGQKLARFLWVVGFFTAIYIADAQANSPALPGLDDTPASEELLRVRTLIRANVLELAERIMEQQGPPMLPNGDWLNWERQLWALYRARGDWQKLYDRTQGIPPAFPSPIKLEAELEAVRSLVAMGDGVRVRRLLRKLTMSSAVSERDKVVLRQQIIESYLVDQLLDEANIAANYFQQDFRPQERDWLILNARISLQSGNPDQAVNALAPLNEPEARLLRNYARLKNKSMTAVKVLENGREFRSRESFAHLKRPVIAVMIEAATEAGLTLESAGLIEQYLVTDGSLNESLNRALPGYSLDDLMGVYQDIAREQANQSGYLAGEEDYWSAFARLIPVEESGIRRAVWAYIVLTSRSEIVRQLGIDNYVNALIDGKRTALVHQVFGQDAPLGVLTLSPATGLRLSNIAIEKGDVQLAANANANVSGPPPGMEFSDWLLYTGRISIIAGRYEQGANQLEKWITSFDKLTPEQTDSGLQPIFDLQTVGQHQLAIPLLQQVNVRSPGARYRREIAFWIAESYGATRQYINAADYYLFSAMQKENGFDQWGVSARYRAAEALTEGNFFSDARTLLEDLLKRAEEDKRKQLLRQKIQQLWLKESSLQSARNGTTDN